MTEEFNRDQCIKNIQRILNLETLNELPHWSTINNFLEQLEPIELEKIIPKLVTHLIRMRTFENSRIRNKYWQILIDGTGLYHFDEKHCPHCLTKKHKNEDGSVKSIEYYHYVLEAKLVLHENIVLSFATEFVENENEDVSKQDCELKAFYRLANKIKSFFKRLPICLTMDSLYACEPVFAICKQHNWHYIIRFKDGSIKSVAEEFHTLKNMEMNQIIESVELGVLKTYKYVRQIAYRQYLLNVVEFSDETKPYPFVFLTDLSISNKNCKQLVLDGRRRWRIENEGFNTQINHGYFLEHMFSKNYKAMKNHYFLIQIAHMISQLLENGLAIYQNHFVSLIEFHDLLKQSFKSSYLLVADIIELDMKIQCRFD